MGLWQSLKHCGGLACLALLQLHTWSRGCFLQYRSGRRVQLESEGLLSLLKETAALDTTSG